MDRDELQERIRARRSGGEPFRRGGAADPEAAYRRFEPEPEDERAQHAPSGEERRPDHFDERAAAAAGWAAAGRAERPPAPAARSDLTREQDDWGRRPAVLPPPPTAVEEPQPEHVDNFDDTAYDEAAGPYEYEDWDDTEERRSSGAGAFAILGFLALGVLALLGGAVLSGLFNGDPGTGAAPSPSPSVSTAPIEATATPVPTDDGSPSPAGSPPASGDPVVFPDGFTAESQPCLPGSADLDGCNSNGAENSGALDVWVGFRNGAADDVVGVTLVGPDGSVINEGSIELADIDCVAPCRGYAWFPFSGLGPGTYEVQVTRNGDRASSMTFEVT